MALNFFNTLRQKMAKFMAGRNGMDEIVRALLWVWPILYILGLITRFGLLMILAEVCVIYMLFRMLSRNIPKRRMESAVFSQKMAPVKKRMQEYGVMFKNRKKYVYFSCPQCKAKLRVPRGVGSVTVTCRQCGHKFDKKA